MKKKLKLNDLQVHSFITSVNPAQVKGGAQIEVPTLEGCFTGVYPTINVQNCAHTQSNGYNCPTVDIPLCQNTAVC